MKKKDTWTDALLSWYQAGHRDLPWRRTKDPYRIWISEIMLQQTRVAAVIPYYERFLALFPTVQALADCNDQDLMKAWEGLGYYSRARNLKKAAVIIVKERNGVFPTTPEMWKELPGIGEYTAGAVAAIAYDYPSVAVDGNFLRVWTRLYAIPAPIDSPATKKRISEEAGALLKDIPEPGAFANAMMELGAMVCMPGKADCSKCPLSKYCSAHAEEAWERYPARSPKKARRLEKRNVFLVTDGTGVVVASRTESLLSGLYGFPNAEGDASPEAMCETLASMGIRAAYQETLGEAEHIFTHITWKMVIHAFRLLEPVSEPFKMADARNLAELPMPAAFRCARGLAVQILQGAKEHQGQAIL